MGVSQSEESSKLLMTIQRNVNVSGMDRELFDFLKPRAEVLTTEISFPSHLNYYAKHQQLEYSLLQDYRSSIFSLERGSTLGHQMVLRRATRVDRPQIWRVIQPNQPYELAEGDTLRLARVELYLKELKHISSRKIIKRQQQEQLPYQLGIEGKHPLKNSGHFNQYQYSKMKASDMQTLKRSLMAQSNVSYRSNAGDRACRICFDGRHNSEDPLFNVCLCAGSVKYVHYECLKSWFRAKTVRMETPHCVLYDYEPLQCELCKYAISNEVTHNGQKYCLFDYEQIHPPFAKFEHYVDNKVREIVIRLEEDLNLMVGRGAENDLNLNDSTISRNHCQLYYGQQRLQLSALESRYGTCVDLNSNIELEAQHTFKMLITNQIVSLRKTGASEGTCCSGGTHSTLLVVQ